MVRTRSQAKQEDETSDDPEPMDIDEDDLAVMSSPPLSEVLMLSSAGSDIQLPPFFSGSLAQAVDTAFNSHPEGEGGGFFCYFCTLMDQKLLGS